MGSSRVSLHARVYCARRNYNLPSSDVVAPGCGPDGNAVQGFVRSFVSEKSEFQHVRAFAIGRLSLDSKQRPNSRDALRQGHHEPHEVHPEELEHEGHFRDLDRPHLTHHVDPHMRQFLHGDRQGDRADPLRMLRPPEMERGWVEQHGRMRGPREETWAREFEEHGEAHEHPWVHEFDRPHDAWTEEFARRSEHETMERAWREVDGDPEGWVTEYGSKFQGRAEDEEEAEWFDSFQKKEAQRKEDNKEILAELSNRLASISDPKMQRSNFVKFINRVSNGEVLLQDGKAIEVDAQGTAKSDDWGAEFDHERQAGVRLPAAAAEAEAWASDFAERNRERSAWAEEFKERHREDGDEWADEYVNEGEDWQADYGKWGETWNRPLDPQTMALQSLDSYQFSENNPYLNHSEPFARGKELLRKAQLSEAIMAFEAEVQKHPDNNEAWRLLGQTHAQNDKDDRAIAALRKSVALNPRDMDAHMSLSVSYTNEMYRDEALSSLERWLQYHPDYKRLLPASTGPLKTDEWGNEFDAHGQPVDKQDKITDLYLEAARMHSDNIDPDVQVALGLLFNLSFEYDKASTLQRSIKSQTHCFGNGFHFGYIGVECFSLALQKRPDDYLLWNKLGATLANSNKSEEAINVYLKALDFNPNFVRARANLGISFLALKDYPSAAQQFIQALRLQPGARHIWANLRTAFSSMERTDLLNKSMKFDINEFAEEFD